MKALITALSDVSLKRENAFGDSGKSRCDNLGLINLKNIFFLLIQLNKPFKIKLTSFQHIF